jgi:hypothetical protein
MEYINTSTSNNNRINNKLNEPKKGSLLESQGGQLPPAAGHGGSSSQEISQDDAWTVIKAYFKQHGLVSQ